MSPHFHQVKHPPSSVAGPSQPAPMGPRSSLKPNSLTPKHPETSDLKPFDTKSSQSEWRPRLQEKKHSSTLFWWCFNMFQSLHQVIPHPSLLFGNNSPHLRRLQCHLRLLPCLGFSRPHSLRLSSFRCRCFNRFRQGLRLEVDSWDQGKIKFISYFISFTWIATAMLLWWNDDNCYGKKNRGEVLH